MHTLSFTDAFFDGILRTPFGQQILTIILILLCLFINSFCLVYIWTFCSCYGLTTLLTFDSAIFLLHRFMGPLWIFNKLFWICGYIWWILQLMATYPYISAALIVILFLSSIIIPIIRWWSRRTTKQKIASIEVCVLSLSERLRRIEEKQEEMLNILRDISQRTQAGPSNQDALGNISD